jgi:S1-C subfamily serine protease
MKRSGRRAFLSSAGTLASVGITGCLGVLDDGEQSRDEVDPSSVNVTPSPASEAVEGTESVYAGVYTEAIDSVVSVRGGTTQGSGYVFDEGHVVTNQHVVGDKATVEVQFSGHRFTTASVAGGDPYSDLAALAIEDRPEYATPLPLASGPPAVGQEVVILGTPFGLDGSLSRGVVGGLNRSLPSPTGFSIPNAIQSDASVNPGNSGGPMLDLSATVLGVVSAGQGNGIGFGISAAMVERVVPALIRTGTFEHTYLGVRLGDVTPRIADLNGLDRPQGSIVVDVLDGTPADGVLQPSKTESIDGEELPVGGDVIVQLDSEPVFTTNDLSTYLALKTDPDDDLSITVIRDGRRQTAGTTLAARPDPSEEQAPN